MNHRTNIQKIASLLLLSTIFLVCYSEKNFLNRSPAELKIAFEAEQKALARGKEIWFDPNIGTNGRNCESCHPDGEMTNAEAYPRYKHILRTMATISMTHNFAVVNESKGKPWEIGSYDANALVLYVTYLANGKKIRMSQPYSYKNECVSKGKILFSDSLFGRSQKSCASCHSVKNNKVTQKNKLLVPGLKGVAAYYPRYSFRQQRVVLLEQEILFCLNKYLNHSEIPLDDERIVALCCFLTSISEGKRISVAKNRGNFEEAP